MSSSSDIVKALLTRLIFACHIIVSVWWVVQVTLNEKLWYLAFFDGLLFLETIFSLLFRRGQEFKWFSPSIFCHLAAIIPCAWILEFHLLDARKNGTSTQPINARIELSAERWTDLVEQTTMLLMILGRWLLPTAQGMTKDSLSQLLLINLAMCADIIEFFDLLKLNFVNQSEKLMVTILVLWTWSLMQFPFNTMSKFDNDEGEKSAYTKKPRIGGRTIVPYEERTFNGVKPISEHRISMASLNNEQAIASKMGSRDILLASQNYSHELPRNYLTDFRRHSFQQHLGEANEVSEKSCLPEVSPFNITEGQRITVSRQTRGSGRFSFDVGQMRPKHTIGRMTTSMTSPNLRAGVIENMQPDQKKSSLLAKSERKINMEATEEKSPAKSRIDSELIAILMSLFLQDGPFLTFRLFIIARYQAYEYMVIFLTAKNALVLVLQVYRLCVLHCTCYDHWENDFSPDNVIDANARLNNVQVAVTHGKHEEAEKRPVYAQVLRSSTGNWESSQRNPFFYSPESNQQA
ncbi:uncharacterized protein [Montipora foliosa]|uniref:uncharacterized protein isoform X1 n=1 Tax=Montipora foliosa TaxID=591990 RepID=UPI0035F1C16F